MLCQSPPCCFLQFSSKTSVLSRSYPFVQLTNSLSSNNLKTNAVIIATHTPKKKKVADLKWQSIDRSVRPTTKVKREFIATKILCLVDRISEGKMSMGINQPNVHYETPNEQDNCRLRPKSEEHNLCLITSTAN